MKVKSERLLSRVPSALGQFHPGLNLSLLLDSLSFSRVAQILFVDYSVQFDRAPRQSFRSLKMAARIHSAKQEAELLRLRVEGRALQRTLAVISLHPTAIGVP